MPDLVGLGIADWRLERSAERLVCLVFGIWVSLAFLLGQIHLPTIAAVSWAVATAACGCLLILLFAGGGSLLFLLLLHLTFAGSGGATGADGRRHLRRRRRLGGGALRRAVD